MKFKGEFMNRVELNKYSVILIEQEFRRLDFNIESSAYPSSHVNFNVILKCGRVIKIKVRAITKIGSYIFSEKTKFNVNDPDLFMAIVFLPIDKEEKSLYLIPAIEWTRDIYPFTGKDYDKPGQVSKPEWGISLSRKAINAIEPYRFNKVIEKL